METDYTSEASQQSLATKEIVSSVLSSAEPHTKVLSMLDQLEIDCHVTEEGALMAKIWWIADRDFVNPQTATAIRSSRPLDKEGKQLDWLSKNLENLCDQYGNEWIAIHDEKVVASGQTVSELMQKIEAVDRPFITFIPSERIVWTVAYGNEKF